MVCSLYYLGAAIRVAAKRQRNNGVVPGSSTCKVRSIAGDLADSKKQCLSGFVRTLSVGFVRNVAKF